MSVQGFDQQAFTRRHFREEPVDLWDDIEENVGDYKVAYRLYKEGKLSEALEECSRCSESSNVFDLSGKIFADQKEWGRAQEQYERGCDLKEPESCALAKSYYCLGIVHYAQRHLAEAIENYSNAFEIYERHHKVFVDLFKNMGRAYKSAKNFPEAQNCFERELAMRTPDTIEMARTHNRLGKVLLSQEKFDEAYDHFQRGLTIAERLAPESIEVAISYNDIGVLYQSQKKYVEAIQMLEKSLAIHEKNTCAEELQACRRNLESARLALAQENQK